MTEALWIGLALCTIVLLYRGCGCAGGPVGSKSCEIKPKEKGERAPAPEDAEKHPVEAYGER